MPYIVIVEDMRLTKTKVKRALGMAAISVTRHEFHLSLLTVVMLMQWSPHG